MKVASQPTKDFQPGSSGGGGVGGTGQGERRDDDYMNEVFEVAIQQGAQFRPAVHRGIGSRLQGYRRQHNEWLSIVR